MQTTRLFEILYLLLNRKSVTARELAEHFGVSTRTIYRDVDHLSLAGIPVYTEQGKGGGISLLPGFVMNKSLLSESEQDEILSALQALSLVKRDEAGQVLEKLSAIFNKSTVNWLEVDFTGWGGGGGEAFHLFKKSILERRVAAFDYYSTSNEATHRMVEPIQLWFKSRAWYVKAYCLLRKDIRLFKLTRVRNLEVTDRPFIPRDLLANLPVPVLKRKRKDVTVIFTVDPALTYRVFDEFCEDDVEPLPDGNFRITVTWLEDDWLYGYLLSYGEHIEVLEPPHIREILREKSIMFTNKHSDT